MVEAAVMIRSKTTSLKNTLRPDGSSSRSSRKYRRRRRVSSSGVTLDHHPYDLYWNISILRDALGFPSFYLGIELAQIITRIVSLFGCPLISDEPQFVTSSVAVNDCCAQ